jgi:hypothetical protein
MVGSSTASANSCEALVELLGRNAEALSYRGVGCPFAVDGPDPGAFPLLLS